MKCAARSGLALPALALVSMTAVPVNAATPVLRGIAVEERLDGPATLAGVVPPGGGAPSLPLIAQVLIDESAFRAADSRAAFDKLDARIALYRARAITVVLSFGRFPATDDQVESWRQAVRSVVERGRGKVAAYQFGDVSAGDPPPAGRYAYLMKLAAVQVRSIDADALVVQGPVSTGRDAWLAALYAEGLAPYVDVLALAASRDVRNPALPAWVDAVGALVAKEDPTASLTLGPTVLSDQPATAVEELINAALGALGTKVQVTVFSGPAASLRSALAAASRMADLFSGDLIGLDASAVKLFRGAVDATADIPHRLLYSPSRSDTYLVYWNSGTSAPVRVVVDISISEPALRDPIAGTTDRIGTAGTEGRSTSLHVRGANHPLVLDFNFGAPARSYMAETRQTVLPSVEEIIAKAQEVQTGQDAAVRNYVASLRIAQHFHQSPADPAINVVTENRMFAQPPGVEWVELSFEVNGATWTSNRPSFPILQAEKVLSLPLDLRLNQDYRYRLDGIDEIDGREAFVVKFEPVDQEHALYRGTVWIDRVGFARLKVSAVQTKNSGIVVSNEEEQIFTDVGTLNGRSILLMTRLTGRQTFLVAGRPILVEREAHMSDVRLNLPDFEATRAEVRAGDQIMYSDTDKGLRYFVKKGNTRVVSDTVTTSSRAFAMGADFDPSFDYPLPIAGLDILDFNFLHRDMQLALLFGGVIGVGNIQRAGIWGNRLDASVDFFGLALKSNDAVFDAHGERRDERVQTIPAATGANLSYRVTSFQRLSGRYEFRFDGYFQDPDSAVTFVTPSSTATNGAGVSYDYRRLGYAVVANATAYRRSTWKPWGNVAEFDPSTRTYTRYDVGLTKDFILNTFHTIHVNGQYFGGQRLDRFSMYQFGLFDAARMHGVPSAVRFAELAMFRGSYSFNLFDQYRLDLFVDQAVGRETGAGAPWQPVTGVGISVNMRGPRSTLLRADFGQSWLPAAYRGAGSTVAQLMILKPL